MTAKAVIVLRHGKSDWAADDGNDLSRPLADRGRRSAAAVGRFLAAVDHVPDLVLCSPATRTRQTIEGAIEAGAWDRPVEICEDLYFGGRTAVLDRIRSLADDVDVVALVGHEPTSSDLVAELVGGGRHRVPTAALARIGFDSHWWRDVAPGRGRLDWLIPPRLLVSAGI